MLAVYDMRRMCLTYALLFLFFLPQLEILQKLLFAVSLVTWSGAFFMVHFELH